MADTNIYNDLPTAIVDIVNDLVEDIDFEIDKVTPEQVKSSAAEFYQLWKKLLRVAPQDSPMVAICREVLHDYKDMYAAVADGDRDTLFEIAWEVTTKLRQVGMQRKWSRYVHEMHPAIESALRSIAVRHSVPMGTLKKAYNIIMRKSRAAGYNWLPANSFVTGISMSTLYALDEEGLIQFDSTGKKWTLSRAGWNDAVTLRKSLKASIVIDKGNWSGEKTKLKIRDDRHAETEDFKITLERGYDAPDAITTAIVDWSGDKHEFRLINDSKGEYYTAVSNMADREDKIAFVAVAQLAYTTI